MTSEIPRAPAGLAPRGRSLWRQVQAAFELDPLESQVLTELCRTLDSCDRIRRELAAASLTVAGSTGQPRVNPLLGALESQVRLADRLASSLGVSLPGSAGGAPQRKAARTRWTRAAKSVPMTAIRGL